MRELMFQARRGWSRSFVLAILALALMIPMGPVRSQTEGCYVVNAHSIDALDSPCMMIFATIYCPDAAGSCEITVCDPDYVPYDEYLRVTCHTGGTDDGLIRCCG
jgi:hypothetical protein